MPAPRDGGRGRARGRLRRTLALVGVVALVGCAASDTSRQAVTDTLPGGTVVTCPRPPQASFETERADALSAAFPEIVQTLLSTASVTEKVDAAFPVAPTPELVEILDYRVCLEYGKGVVPAPSYDAWVREVRPALLQRVGGPPADTGSADVAEPR